MGTILKLNQSSTTINLMKKRGERGKGKGERGKGLIVRKKKYFSLCS